MVNVPLVFATTVATLLSFAVAPSSDAIKPCAYVTVVLTEDFVDCSVALVRSIRGTQTQHDVIVLVLPDIAEGSRVRLRNAGADHVVEIDEVQNPNENVQYQIFAKNYCILRTWQISSLVGTNYDRAVYMDSDMIMLQNSDDLCLLPELSAARDLGGEPSASSQEPAGHISEFNAGMMVLVPSELTFERLLRLAPQVHSPSGGVQPLLRAAFPGFHPLDHYRDNVNARIYELSRSRWKLGQIRSIHYTGPTKPCFTTSDDVVDEPVDHPIRVWHMLQDGDTIVGVQSDSKSIDGTRDMTAREAWHEWFPLREGTVLHSGFGYGEHELKIVPAHHASKHISAALETLAQQVFLAGFKHLQACQGHGAEGCSKLEDVAHEITRSAAQMQRTARLFLQRASKDVDIDLPGLGSVRSIITSHVDMASSKMQQGLKSLVAEQISSGSRVFSFDLVAGLVRRIRRQQELMRWHLSYALVVLLSWQVRSIRESGQNPAFVPDSFSFILPTIRFQQQCCRSWDVFAGLLNQLTRANVEETPGANMAVLVGGPSASGDLEAMLQLLVHGLQVASVSHGFVVENAVDKPALVILGCSVIKDEDDDPEAEYRHVFDDLKRWWHFGSLVAGCGFSPSRSGIIEAVSQHALELGIIINLAADGTWWLPTDA